MVFAEKKMSLFVFEQKLRFRQPINRVNSRPTQTRQYWKQWHERKCKNTKSSACANSQTPDVDFRSVSPSDDVQFRRSVLRRTAASPQRFVGFVDVAQTEIWRVQIISDLQLTTGGYLEFQGIPTTAYTMLTSKVQLDVDGVLTRKLFGINGISVLQGVMTCLEV